jgi:hypothetical protein
MDVVERIRKLHLAPVVISARADTDARHDATFYPSGQNPQLAARIRKLRTTSTTAQLFEEEAVKQLLGIPNHVTTYTPIPTLIDEVRNYDRGGRVGLSAR